MKVSACLKGQPDAHGCYAIYIRVADGKFRKTTATKYRVLPTQFDKGKVIKRADADIINKALQVKIAQRIIGGNEDFGDAWFAEYVDQLIKETDKERSYETLRQYKGEKTKLEGFQSPVKLSQITPSFLRSYSTYCYGLGNTGNTVWKSFKFLRMLLRKAHKEKVIAENPFDGFAMPKYKDPKKNLPDP